MLMVMALSITSCSDLKLKMKVSELNAKCPLKIDERGKLESVSLDNNVITFKLILPDVAFEDIDETLEFDFGQLVTRSLLVGIKMSNEKFIQSMVEAKASVRTIIAPESGRKELMGEFSSEEIVELLNSKDQGFDSLLRSIVDSTNKTLPEDLGDGLTLASLKLTDNLITYEYSLDESQGKIEELKNCSEELEEVIKTNIRTDPTSMGGKVYFEMIEKTGRGLMFRYEGSTSKESFAITISNTELKELLD